MKKIILFTIFFSSVSLAQISAEYQYAFIFSDEINNTEELILGKDPFGSDGIDTLFGEHYVSQVPAGEFGVRFQLPIDTSIYTIKDIRFGCYWATGHQHLIDISYATGSSSISVDWEWDSFLEFGLMDVIFINPYNGQILSSHSWFSDSSFYQIQNSLDKIEIWTTYNGTLSWETFFSSIRNSAWLGRPRKIPGRRRPDSGIRTSLRGRHIDPLRKKAHPSLWKQRRRGRSEGRKRSVCRRRLAGPSAKSQHAVRRERPLAHFDARRRRIWLKQGGMRFVTACRLSRCFSSHCAPARKRWRPKQVIP